MSFSLYMRDAPCPTCGRGEEAWHWDNMTYNLVPMFRKAGFYKAIKGPKRDFFEFMKGTGPAEENDRGVCVSEVVDLVRAGVSDMEANPGDYRALNPENGWGDYDGALKFTRELLGACEEHPGAVIEFSG